MVHAVHLCTLYREERSDWVGKQSGYGNAMAHFPLTITKMATQPQPRFVIGDCVWRTPAETSMNRLSILPSQVIAGKSGRFYVLDSNSRA